MMVMYIVEEGYGAGNASILKLVCWSVFDVARLESYCQYGRHYCQTNMI